MSIIKQDYGSLGNDVQTQMLIAPVLSNMVATQVFAVGDQFIVDNVLYKATKAIAIGDTISVGTSASDNCVLSDSITQQIQNQRISYKDVALGTATIGASGYLNIESYQPTPESGKTLLFVMVKDFGTSGGAVIVTTGGKYLMGTPNTNVSYLNLRYFYQ